MEKRNNCFTPRDMVGDELLEKLLGEDIGGGCGNYGDCCSSGCAGESSHACGRRSRQSAPEYGERCGDGKMNGFPIAMAYVPIQEWEGIYEAEEALSHGTMFSALELPFYPSACGKGCGCR